MTDNEFNRVLDNISKERFENNMVKSATQIINANFFTSEQVKQMLQLFNSENNKLDLAKLAYDQTVDQRNFSVVNDVFSYSNSKDELARYIRSH
jgi:thymidine kinase